MAQRKKIYGIGINDAPYVTAPKVGGKQVVCNYYATWKSMFVRSYSENYKAKQVTYEGCEVDQSWHLFSRFREWMERQEWQGMALDKDLLVAGNKTYGPDVCCFVPQFVNNCFRAQQHKQDPSLPLGVCAPNRMSGSIKPYSACIYIEGEGTKHLGHFATVLEAHRAWQLEKLSVIDRVYDKYEKLPTHRADVLMAIRARGELIAADINANRVTSRP